MKVYKDFWRVIILILKINMPLGRREVMSNSKFQFEDGSSVEGRMEKVENYLKSKMK